MTIGENFTILEILENNQFFTELEQVTGETQELKIAKVLDINSKNLYNYNEDQVVLIDPTFIVVYFTNSEVAISNDGIICAFDIETANCITCNDFRTIDNLPSKYVVKESIPDEDLFLRNELMQNNLVIFGGVQSDFGIIDFDTPVIITASPNKVKRVATNNGKFFVCNKDDFIIIYDE